jgi:hypothetical protein
MKNRLYVQSIAIPENCLMETIATHTNQKLFRIRNNVKRKSSPLPETGRTQRLKPETP